MGPLTFFFDRNFGTRLPAALNSMKPPMRIKWHQEQGFDPRMPDDKWLEVVGQRNWVVLSQDRKFHLLANELVAVKQHKVRCFYLPCASQDRWHSLCNFIRRYERMMDLAWNQAAPFIYELRGNGRFYSVPLP